MRNEQRKPNTKQGEPGWRTGPQQGLQESSGRRGHRALGVDRAQNPKMSAWGFLKWNSGTTAEWLYQHQQSEAKLRPK